ncbi:MAG: hypothetical protein ACSHYB_19590 [Roseibacillus sp.]
MTRIEALTTNAFHERLDSILLAQPVSDEARVFESATEEKLFQKLDGEWQNGWDFELVDAFFDGRGCSLLIQNAEVDWRDIWQWLESTVAEAPEGAIFNFEVWDNIHDGIMDSSNSILRRVVTREGTIEEAET